MGEIDLHQFRFFEGVAPGTLTRVAQNSALLSFKAGDVIFEKGDPSDALFGLVGGEVSLNLMVTDSELETDIKYEEAIKADMIDKKQQIVVATVEPGQVFGWSALAGSPKRTVTAQSRQASRVISIPADHLSAAFEDDPLSGYKLMKRLCDIIAGRLQARTDKLIDVWVEAFGVTEI